ncbi:hypothetical protein IAQ61_000890 [Plenodomus lingam]|uniref:uncharacterized protein n=1 Tax=Leptosphaeria maculans TaxID=5022 RepID=UPI00331B449B|nr:hypothetical protein IAQ61_000890 [Plenodomus lingam]
MTYRHTKKHHRSTLVVCSDCRRVVDAAVGNDVSRFLLGHIYQDGSAILLDIQITEHTWGILYLCHSLFAATFAEQDSCSGSVCEDMTTDWLATISTSEESTGSWITLDLVGQEHRNIEFCLELAGDATNYG